MLKNDWTYENIDRYLIGILSEEERIAFESELAVDADLQKQVEKHKEINQLLYERRLLQLRNTMKRDIKSGAADRIIQRGMFRKLWMGFGVLLFGIIGALMFLKFHGSKTYENENPENKTEEIKRNTATEVADAKSINIRREQKTTTIKADNFPQEKSLDIVSTIKTDTSQIVKNDGNVENTIHPKIITNDEKPANDIERKSHDCADIHIVVQGKTTETCPDKNEGSVQLNIKGGTVPYTTSLYTTTDSKPIETGNLSFDHLSAGLYQARVKDANGCSAKVYEIEIKEKNCPVENLDEYSFRPEYNEQFKFLAEKTGNISISDRSGKEVFTAPVHVGSEFTWDGIDKYGKSVEKGIYLLVVTYADGDYKKGYITVY